jgi:carbonic anhydrase/acetyltransferase-like protein (isoleucine patch superfamily)
MIHRNPTTDFWRTEYSPEVDASAFVHPLAAVIGHVIIGKKVFVAPFASVRGDEGHPIFVDDESNIQDGVVIHALETERNGEPVEANLVDAAGKRYAVHIGRRVSLAHQAQIHGPALVGEGTFVGMKSLVFRAQVGRGCVVEPGCIIMGVNIADGRIVPAGTVLREQREADSLPKVTEDYPLKSVNQAVVRVNTGLTAGYKKISLP